MKDIVIFIGPPGAGKGTLARLCCERMNWTQLSTGDLCRQHVVQKTELGQQIDLLIKSGKLISDSLVLEMVKKWLQEQLTWSEGIILDGFPRTQVQAEMLDLMLRETLQDSYTISVVKMELDPDIVVRRLMARVVCSNKTCQAVFSTKNIAKTKKNNDSDELVCAECSSPLVRRADDVEPVICERLSIYQSHASQLLDYYKASGRPIYSLDVAQPVEGVFEQFVHLKNGFNLR